MKIQRFTIVLLLLANVAYGQSKKSDLKKLHWLKGAWEQTNVKPGTSAQEIWTISNTNELVGNAETKKGDKVVFVEKLKLTYKDDAIYYVADVSANTAPVWFKITEVSNHHFVCENATNDFPKKIAYTLNTNKLLL